MDPTPDPLRDLLDALEADKYAKFTFAAAIKAARKALDQAVSAKASPLTAAIASAERTLALLKEAAGPMPTKSPKPPPAKPTAPPVGTGAPALAPKPEGSAKGQGKP